MILVLELRNFQGSKNVLHYKNTLNKTMFLLITGKTSFIF